MAARHPTSGMVAAGCCLALLTTMATASPAQASGHVGPPPVQKLPPVAVQPVAATRPSPSATAQKALKGTPPASSLPGAGSVVVDVPGPAGAASPAARAGGLPVRMGTAAAGAAAPTRVQVATLDQSEAARAGLKGVLFRVARADGGSASATVPLTLSYAGFRNADGADWSTRLRLWSVPECALTAPGKAGCAPVPVPSTNNPVLGEVSGQVVVSGQAATPAAPATSGSSGARTGAAAGGAGTATTASAAGAAAGTLMALAAGPSGSVGDFTATSLAASATWSSGTSTGDFTWNYPIRVPPAIGGPAPQLSLSYSSQSVDGRTAASNNQPSWVGEGFEMWPGYIERRYKACSDDMGGSGNNTTATGDLCWGTDNATMSLGGKASELVRDDASGAWHPRVEDGSRIQRLTLQNGSNGDTANSPPSTLPGARWPGAGTWTTSWTPTATRCPTGTDRRPTSTAGT